MLQVTERSVALFDTVKCVYLMIHCLNGLSSLRMWCVYLLMYLLLVCLCVCLLMLILYKIAYLGTKNIDFMIKILLK